MKASIITVCKNSEKCVERAIQSVLMQSYNDIEYIIIDGASTDKTLSIIEKYKENIDVLISEKDRGIYNAMNKGIVHSSGDVLYFLNSDDLLYDEDVINDVMSEFSRNSNLGVLYGNVIISDGQNEKIVEYRNLTKRFFYKNNLCHQAVFSRKKVFNEIGNFNENYKIHADIDWLMRAYFKTNTKFRYLDRIICIYSTLGFCSNPINAQTYKFDRQKISAKYFFEAKFKLIIKQMLGKFGYKKYYYISKHRNGKLGVK